MTYIELTKEGEAFIRRIADWLTKNGEYKAQSMLKGNNGLLPFSNETDPNKVWTANVVNVLKNNTPVVNNTQMANYLIDLYKMYSPVYISYHVNKLLDMSKRRNLMMYLKDAYNGIKNDDVTYQQFIDKIIEINDFDGVDNDLDGIFDCQDINCIYAVHPEYPEIVCYPQEFNLTLGFQVCSNYFSAQPFDDDGDGDGGGDGTSGC